MDIWTLLRTTNRPIVFYGTGNGGDMMAKILSSFNKKVDGVFASPGFVRNRTFLGLPVTSFEECLARFGNDMIVLMVFGTKDLNVISYVKEISTKCDLYIPDLMTDENGEPFTLSYLDKHLKEIENIYNRLEDERSKEVFQANIKHRLFGRLEDIETSWSNDEENWSLLELSEDEVFFDAGAYNGDTVKRFLSLCKNYNHIYAVEPDPKTFKKLAIACENLKNVTLINAALSNYDGLSNFTFGKGRGNSKGGSDTICQRSIDSILSGQKASFIKYDIEGEEEKGLLGASNTIKTFKPKILLSAYHKIDDIFHLPAVLDRINSSYSYALRKSICIPSWDLYYLCR